MENMQSKQKTYICPFAGCTSTFNRPYRLAQHRLVHVNIKPFVCHEENCSKAYTSKSHLDRHINSVHRQAEVILFCCPICIKNYSNRQNLKRHIRKSHIERKTYICDYCSTLFKKKHQLKAHMYIHTGVKSFRCSFCPKDYVTLAERKKHMRNHKEYSCSFCDAKFNRWTDVLLHKKNDHQSQEYICNDCGRIFKDRSHIVRHVKKHMSVAVSIFFCPYSDCPRTYSRNSNLKQHIQTKHEHRTFDCPLCGAKLSTKAKMNEHIERHARPEVILRIPKTKENGRKIRKDMNTVKEITALKIAGIEQKDILNEEEDVTDDHNEISNGHSIHSSHFKYELQIET